MRKLKLKKCTSCGTVIRILEDYKCNDEIICCNTKMEDLSSNNVDASFEKHVPTYEIKNDYLEVKVNHVMEEDHYIEWICLVNDKEEKYVYLNPFEDAIATFESTTGTLYAYCNKHGLWENEIK